MSKQRWKNFNGNDDECAQVAEFTTDGDPILYNFEFETPEQHIRFNVTAACETEAWEQLETALDTINDDLLDITDCVYIFGVADIDKFTIQQE